MNIMNEIQERRSIRKYKSQEVKDEDLLQIIEAARLAPSGNNTQPWRFIIIKDQQTKENIVAEDHNQKWMLTAPVFIACISDISARIVGSQSLYIDESSSEFELKQIIRDTSIAISYMLLEAQHLGLGTCWTGWYNQKEMRKVLGIPYNMYVSGILTVGYADEQPAQRPRKELEELVCYEKWEDCYGVKSDTKNY